MSRWVRFNGLSLVMFAAFLVFLVLQSVFGWEYTNQNLADHGGAVESYWSYLGSGNFVEATFENWESEFLQMGSYVLLAAYLVQKGSPESKPLDEKPGEDGEPVRAASPEPARRGGVTGWLYENSLSLALFGLFALSFGLHLLGATAAHNDEQILHGQPTTSVAEFLVDPEFWFQSMQNWQSEFLSVGVLIVLSVFLRQRGSSQSKPVAAPHAMTGS
ncbi:MAG TPA: DUF6766 family protein [Planosporangium sp.]|nr:DUF6766 family protein [Planosporangium sp.]